jgi:hypothetical protein
VRGLEELAKLLKLDGIELSKVESPDEGTVLDITDPVVGAPSGVDPSVGVGLGTPVTEELKKPVKVVDPDDMGPVFGDDEVAVSDVKGPAGTLVAGTEADSVMGTDETREELK